MMIPHINIKNSLKVKSDDSRTKKYVKSHFSVLTLKTNFVYSLWKLKLSKSAFKSTFFCSDNFLKKV